MAAKASGMPLALMAVIFTIEYLQYHPYIWSLKYIDLKSINTKNRYN